MSGAGPRAGPAWAGPPAGGPRLTLAFWSRAKISEELRWCPVASWVQRAISHAPWGASVPRLTLLAFESSIAIGVRSVPLAARRVMGFSMRWRNQITEGRTTASHAAAVAAI